MKNIFSRITGETMKRNKSRTIVTIIGVILSTAMLTAIAVFATSFQGYLIDHTRREEGAWHLRAEGVGEQDLELMSEDDRIKGIYKSQELGYAKNLEAGGGYIRVLTRGKELDHYLPMKLEKGRAPKKEDEILIPGYMEGYEVGDTLTLELGSLDAGGTFVEPGSVMDIATGELAEGCEFRRATTRTFRVTGTYENAVGATDVFFGGMTVFTGAAQEQLLTEEAAGGKEWYDVYVELKNPFAVSDFETDWFSGKNGLEGVAYERHSDLLRWMGVSRNGNLTAMLYGFAAVLLGVVVLGAVSLIYNSFAISLRERTTQFGLLASVGATKKQIRHALEYEAVIVSAAGIPLGILAGILGSSVTLRVIGSGMSRFLFGTQEAIPVKMTIPALAAAAVLSILTVLISVWIPARRVRKISPMDAIRSSADIRILPKDVRTWKLGYKIAGLEGMLAEKNYKRDRRKYRATVVSLSISIVLFVTASLFLSYLTSASGFILNPPKYDVELEVYLDAQGGEQARELVDKTLKKESTIESCESYKTTDFMFQVEEDELHSAYRELHYWREDKEGKQPFSWRVIVLNDKDYQEFLQQEDIPAPMKKEEELEVLYTDSIRVYQEEKQRYETIHAFTSDMEGKTLVAGAYDTDDTGTYETFDPLINLTLAGEVKNLPKQYSSAQSGEPLLILSEEQLEQYQSLQNQSPVSISQNYMIQSSDYSGTMEHLKKALADVIQKGKVNVYCPAEMEEGSRQSLMAVKVLGYGFVVLISLIAIANVFNTISTNLMLRRKEFAMLRSTGLSGKGFGRMLRYECLIYGIRSIIYGTILSIGVSLLFWRLVTGVSVQAFLLPWKYLLTAAVGVLLIVFLTMFYTMKKIRRYNIIDELRIA